LRGRAVAREIARRRCRRRHGRPRTSLARRRRAAPLASAGTVAPHQV
jgi:hypothetical protein